MFEEFHEGNYVRVVRNWQRGERGIPFDGLREDVIKAIEGESGCIENICTSTYCIVKFPAALVPGKYIYAPFFALEKVA